MAEFLSEEWLVAAHEIYSAHAGSGSANPVQVQVNLVVREAPFGDGTVQAHLDADGPETEIGAGHIEGAATTVTTDYATARAIFVEQDQTAAMQAFMGGKIQVSGDMTKLMMMMSQAPDPSTYEIAQALKDMTD